MINYICAFKQKAFLFAIMCVVSSQNVFCSQDSLMDRFLQSNLEKKASWNMLEPGRVLTAEEIAVIKEGLDTQKTKIYCGESQIPEHRERGLQTVSMLCVYLDYSENKKDRYPQMIFGPHQERTT